MKFKFLLVVALGLLVLLVWLERFLPAKKHNISLPRKVLRFMNHYFVKITSSQTSHNSSSWKDSVAIIFVLGAVLTFILL